MQGLGREAEIGLGNAAAYLRAIGRRPGVVIAMFFLSAFFAFAVAVYEPPEYEAGAKILVKDTGPQAAISQLQSLSALSAMSSGTETELQIIKSRTSIEEALDKLHMDVDVIRDGRDTPLWRFEDVLYRYTRLAPEPDPRLDLARLRLDSFSAPEGLRPFSLGIKPDGDGFDVIDAGGTFGPAGAVLGRGKVGETFSYKDVSFFVGEMRDYGATAFTLRVKERYRVIERLTMGLAAKEAGFQSGVVNLRFTDHNPVRAADFVNEVIHVYQERSTGITQDKASQTLEFIDSQLASVEKSLDSARESFDAYRSKKGTILLSEEAKGLIGQLVDVETRLEAAKFQLDQTRRLKKRLVSGDTEDYILSSPDMGQGPIAVAGADLFNKLIELELERSNLLQVMTPAHKDVKNIDARIKELKGIIITNLDNYILALNNQISDYQGLSGGYRSQMKGLPATESEVTALSTELEVYLDLYKTLRQQKQDAEISKASEISKVYILDPAVPPEKHVRPMRLMSAAVGGVVGLFLGAVIAVFMASFVTVIRVPEDAERALGLPVAGVIPETESLTGQQDVTGKPGFGGDRDFNRAINALRDRIVFSVQPTPVKLMSIISLEPGDGKTIASCSLANAFAQSGRRVVIVDADLRRPGVHKYFGLGRDNGLAEYLAGSGLPGSYLRRTEQDNLHVITSGKTPPNPLSATGNDRMHKLIADLSDAYDVAIFNVSPMMIVGDSVFICRRLDAVFLLLHAGKTRADDARTLAASAMSAGIPLRGVILNRVSPRYARLFHKRLTLLGEDEL